MVELDSRVELANVKAGRGMILPVGGRQLALSVVENDLRSADYKLVFKTLTGDIEIPRPENTTYKGRVIGDNFSNIRLALDGKKIEGIIITQSSEYYIEPANVYSQAAAANEFIIYEAKDLINGKEIFCPLVNKIEAGMRMVNAKFNDKSFKNIFAGNFKENFARSLPPGNRILNLSTDADLEYVKIFGKATQY